MPQETPAPIISDDEIAAAISEAEASGEHIPSLDGSKRGVVHVPVEAASVVEPKSATPAPSDRVAVSAKLPAEEPPEQDGAGEPGALGKLLRRLAPALAAWLQRVPGSNLVGQWAGRLWRGAYAGLDWTLMFLNRPFEWMSPEVRSTVGLGAMVTIVMSLLAGLLLPRLYPPRDVITQLTNQRAEVQSQAQGASTQPAQPDL